MPVKFNIKDHVLETLCQGCSDGVTLTPLEDLGGSIKGVWTVPDVLRCTKCNSFITQRVRELTKDEKKAKKEN